MYEAFFVIGLAISILCALLVAIPLTVGTVQFWMQFIELMRKRKGNEKTAKQQVPPAA